MEMALEEFTQRTLDLLELERDAEIEETLNLTKCLSARELERKGVCLLKLLLKSRRSGLYGRMVALFEPSSRSQDKNGKQELPSHNITPGDIVGVSLMKSEQTDKPLITGIVSQVSAFNISVACDDSQDIFELDEDEMFKLIKLANDVTYRRLKTTLNDLAKYRSGPSQMLINVFFGQAEISKPSGDFPITFVNESLDESQREAVRFALSQKEFAVIHGPPGTGKTTTVVELIIQALRQGLKVLATAPSNIAVDNLVERLASYKQRIVRIGHPARLLPHLQKYSLDAIVSGTEETDIVKDVKSDLQKIIGRLKKVKNVSERRELRKELKSLRREITQREEAATREVLSKADVVLVTLTSASNDGPLKHLSDDHFDLVIIDECSQALEAACWIGLLRGPRCVLAGDHLQLPPTILSKQAASEGLELTLMERVLNLLSEEKGHDVVRMLTTQYRMHQNIMEWVSHEMYQDKLAAHSSVAAHLLRDMEQVSACEESSLPLLLIDTAGCDLHELELPEEASKGNEGEADIVAAYVKDLVQLGVKPLDIAVISPYNLQVDLLRLRLLPNYPDLEVKTVDGFQGREKEAVIISMVRSNSKGEVGFLADKRRINVAITRARRHLCVVCDSETVSQNQFIKSLISYMSMKGEVWSAQQYIQEGKVQGHMSDLMDREKKKKYIGEKPSSASKQQNPRKPLQSKEEKSSLYQQQLKQFVKDSDKMTLDFPSSLNSHDRLVVHEVAEKLNLYHCSVGEGKKRHIQISKLPPVPSDQFHTLDYGISECQKHALREENIEKNEEPDFMQNAEDFKLLEDSRISFKESPDIIESQSDEFGLHETSATIECSGLVQSIDEKVDLVKGESMEKDCTLVASSNQNHDILVHQQFTHSQAAVGGHQGQDLREETYAANIPLQLKKKELLKPRKLSDKASGADLVSPCSTLLICHYCYKEVLDSNLSLHELHCSRQKELATNGKPSIGMDQSVKERKEKKSERQKKQKTLTKVSQVQKATDVLKNIDDNDFDGLIATITKLDSKCAFKKCKTLTDTLGRNCDFCTRRFCLSHLLPELHGCGDAAKESARRTIIRDGVLHRGSMPPSKKPNEIRRAQLENKMEKKLGELAEKRMKNKNK